MAALAVAMAAAATAQAAAEDEDVAAVVLAEGGCTGVFLELMPHRMC